MLTAEATIRQELRPGDLGAVARLHGVVYAREYGLDHRIEASVAAGLAAVADALAGVETDRPARLWVAERDGEVVGAIGITAETEDVARLRWFIVAPAVRGAGVGARLLDEALAWVRERGFRLVYLFTFGDLRAAAHLYARAGFERVSERVGTEWHDTMVEERWELRLG